MPKSSVAILAILTFWLGWSCDAHTHRGKSPDATSLFASGHRLSGIHLPDGCHKTRSRDWPVSCLCSTLSLTYPDDLYNEESEDGEGESTEGYGLGVMPVFCGMTDDIGWQFALLLSPEAVASPWARAVLRC
ncbi:MAG TPA: hypothetical protein VJY33_26030 [Isosphaeraceae bacterium]|nr:hypothetical protein [Isosphaeraceae bacterium]